MSQPNNNDVDATNTQDNEIINNTVNSFLHNITNSVYNNTFMNSSNTIFNDAFITNISPTTPHLPPPDVSPDVFPVLPSESPFPTPPNIRPPPQLIGIVPTAIGLHQLNHPNIRGPIGGSVGNRFLLRPMRFHRILPDGTYDNVLWTAGNTQTHSNDTSILNSVIQRSFNEDPSAFKQVISDEGKQLLETVQFSSLDTEETKCTIMQDAFEDDTMVIELPCKHVFCEEAIMHWLKNESASCPVCRHKLPSKEVRIEKNRNISELGESEDTEENGLRVRSSSAPTPLNENISLYYHSIINNITRLHQLNEEEDTQQAIWNSIANS